MVGEEKYGRYSPRQWLLLVFYYALFTFVMWLIGPGPAFLVAYVCLVKLMEPLADALRRSGGYEPLVCESLLSRDDRPLLLRLRGRTVLAIFVTIWVCVTVSGAWLIGEALPYAVIQAFPIAAIMTVVLIVLGPWLLGLFAEFFLGFLLSLADVLIALLVPRSWRLPLHAAIDRLDHWIVDLYFQKQVGIAARSDLSEYAREQAGLDEAPA